MKTEYMVLCTEDIDDIERWVDEYLRKGWKLQGGVSVSHVAERINMYAQALVREVVE